LRSFPRLIAAHFASPGLCYAKPLSGLAKRRKQPERYATFALKLVKIIFKILTKYFFCFIIEIRNFKKRG
jgi:hypothetical protein